MNVKRIFVIVLVLSLLAVLGVSSVSAQAVNQSFTSSITYYTPSAAGGTLQIQFTRRAAAQPSIIPLLPSTLIQPALSTWGMFHK